MDANALSAIQAYGKAAAPGAATGSGLADKVDLGTSFKELVDSTLGDTVNATSKSETAALAQVAGEADLVDVVTAVANAEVVVETVVAVRDRVIQAYNDIIRMPI